MLDQIKHDYQITFDFSVISTEEDAASALEHHDGWAEAIGKLESALEALKEDCNLKSRQKLSMKADCVDSTRMS